MNEMILHIDDKKVEKQQGDDFLNTYFTCTFIIDILLYCLHVFPPKILLVLPLIELIIC